MAWTLTYSATEQSLATWGLSNVQRVRRSIGEDRLSARIDGDFDGAAAFPWGGKVVLKKDATTWFTGWCVTRPRFGSGSEEYVDYEFVGPWAWFLERHTLDASWKVYDTVGEAVADADMSRLVIGQAPNGSRLSVAAVVQSALQSVIDAGAEIQIGTISLQVGDGEEPEGFDDIYAPFDEVVDMTAAEVIKIALRWVPDAVLWFDYSTAPPTVNCRRRADLAAASLAVGTTDVDVVDIQSREDRQVPFVFLRYEQTHLVDNETYFTLVQELWPSGADTDAFGGIKHTIELSGTEKSTVRQEIETAALPADPYTDSSWWTSKLPWLGESVITGLTLSNGARTGTLPYELVKGTIPTWAAYEASENPDGVQSEEAVFTVSASYTIRDPSDSYDVEKVVGHILKVKVTAIDVDSRTLSSTSITALPETIVVGLAKALYESLATLEYSGTVVRVEQDVTGAVSVGNKLNLTGGLAGWATMNARVNAVTETIDTGETRIDFGPPNHLGPDDLIEQLRRNRRRHASFRFGRRATGKVGDGDAVDLGGGESRRDAASGGAGGRTQILVLKAGDSTTRIELTPGDLATGQVIKPREIDVCDGGVAKKMMVLATLPYTP